MSFEFVSKKTLLTPCILISVPFDEVTCPRAFFGKCLPISRMIGRGGGDRILNPSPGPAGFSLETALTRPGYGNRQSGLFRDSRS